MKNGKTIGKGIIDLIAGTIGAAFVAFVALVIGGVISNYDREKLEIDTDFELRDADNIIGVEMVKLTTEHLTYGDSVHWAYTYIDSNRENCESAYLTAFGIKIRMTEAMHVVNFFEGL